MVRTEITDSTDSEPTDSTGSRSTDRTLSRYLLGGARLLTDLVVLGLWTIFLTLLFLSTAWPRWAYYVILVGGAAVYVVVTAPWIRSPETPG
ncbi:hypothetical protein [Natronosalvus vescus]|uniref:hypothetical protein n=1 Tax=Natronosalvus vescus TaxID=2953881 RepID=UPI0020900DB3|nr:hypothetical protein [Natronosalvus vescus]